MSKKTDDFEIEIVTAIKNDLLLTNQCIPSDLPSWMLDIGIKPNAKVIDVERIGSSGSKTDVIIRLENSEPIKISAKLSSAHYFGNWYSHTRIINEFGEDLFEKLVLDCTSWANEWHNTQNASLYVGVSICFGKRSGKTAREFTEVFTYEDIVTIVAGYGSGESIANCLYVSPKAPVNLEDLINKLQPIDENSIKILSEDFKVAYRPINPMTEGSNRGKCIYTQFHPSKALSEKVVVTSKSELMKLGEFVPVEANSLNHNRLLNELEEKYNIVVPRK